MGYFSNDAAPENRSTSSSRPYSRRAGSAPPSNLFAAFLLLTILEGMRRLKTATTPTTERVTRQTKGKVSEFNAFQREYLAVYLVIMSRTGCRYQYVHFISAIGFPFSTYS